MERKTINLEIEFESYIAHPYWPEREESISIEKDSGVNRQKSEEKRQAALAAECDKRGITLADYRAMKIRAARPFYRTDCDDTNTPIVIPRHQIAGAVVETIGKSPKAVRGPFDKDNFRFFCRLSDLVTTKTTQDGVFDRYVKLEGSNMRNRQVNPFIKTFTATGTVEIPEDIKPDDVKRVLKKAVEENGLGACRKMGYGRGTLTKFDVVEDEAGE